VRFQAALATVGALLYPSAALACPYCAGRNDGGAKQLVMLAAFVFFPFALVATIAFIVKAGNRES
jgi:hypothetical protein